MTEHCLECGGWTFSIFGGTHRCAPWFEVWRAISDEWPEASARRIRAHGPELAARMWAELEDAQGEYSIVRGEDVECVVRDVASGEVSHWVVTGHAEPTYSATLSRATR